MIKPFHPGEGWHVREPDEHFDTKHILIEWTADASVRRVWVEDITND